MSTARATVTTPPVTTPPVTRAWRSWHLHVDSLAAPVLDSVVRSAVAPTITELGRRDRGRPAPRPWFFLRYWQGGPHVRVRIPDLDDAGADAVTSALACRIAEVNASVPAEERITVDAYRRAAAPIAALGEAGTALPVDDLLPGGAHPSRYVPEYARYGGTALMDLSEDLFHASSVVTLRACLARDGQRRALADGLEALAATVSAWPRDRMELLRAVRDGWSVWLSTSAGGQDSDRYAREVATRIHQLRPTADGLRALVDGAECRWSPWTRRLGAAAAVWIDAAGTARAAQIFGSHLHMTQNRLGVGGGREGYLAAVLLGLISGGSVDE